MRSIVLRTPQFWGHAGAGQPRCSGVVSILLYRIPGSVFSTLLAVVCVLFCLSGAVNSGWSRYWLAIPWAALLVWIVRRRAGWWHTLWLAPFFAACVYVSETQDTNPWLFPGLHSEVTLRRDACLVQYSDELVPWITPACGDFGVGKVVGTVKAGTRFRVEGIRHSYANMGDQVDPVVSYAGKLHPVGRDDVDSATPLQAEWSRYASILMMWPVFPLMLRAFIG